MKQFRSLIVVVAGKDGGQLAVDQAATLAAQNSGTVTLVDAITPLSDFLEIAGSNAAECHDEASKLKTEHMERLAKPLRDRGTRVDCLLLQGDLAERTVERVIVHGHDLLLKTAEHPHGITQHMFGTVGQRLMRKCPCPVWIIKAAPEPKLKKILVAISPFPLEQQRHPMNVMMMKLATSLTCMNDCELNVVSVWPDLALATKNEQSETKLLQDEALEEIVGPYRCQVDDLQTHLLEGDPADAITGLTLKLDVDLLVLGTVCRSNFVFFTMGNTAEQVLQRVQCSVLAVKPDWFLASVAKAAQERSRLFDGLLSKSPGLI
ncbi:Universal stress protein E [Stieleria bergensis]|uniref:Universal stress protein E n=1 Tax=Stieleria bergensis TaxID=2528025 RepID=A0A517SWJ7_9BACT|nr:Universal stress protein E [Planctomycetes bacterium SV_7m_r]